MGWEGREPSSVFGHSERLDGINWLLMVAPSILLAISNFVYKQSNEEQDGQNEFMGKIQRFRKGVGGRGLATKSAQNTTKMPPRIVFSHFIRGHRKTGQKKGLNLWCGRDFLAPTPSVRQPLFETSEKCSSSEDP